MMSKVSDLGLGQVGIKNGGAFASLEHLLEFFYDNPFPEPGDGHVPLKIMYVHLPCSITSGLIHTQAPVSRRRPTHDCSADDGTSPYDAAATHDDARHASRCHAADAVRGHGRAGHVRLYEHAADPLWSGPGACGSAHVWSSAWRSTSRAPCSASSAATARSSTDQYVPAAVSLRYLRLPRPECV